MNFEHSENGGEQIAQKIADLESRLEAVEAENERLRDRVDELEEENERLSSRVEELESRPTVEYSERDAGGMPVASSLSIGEIEIGKRIYDDEELKDLDDRLWNVEERLEEASLGTAEDRIESTETREESASKLLSVVTWSESQAEEYLTTNQKHARDVAKDLGDYSTKTPKGYRLRSRDVRTVLSAWGDGRPHDETVRRVMDFLLRFAAEDDVEEVNKNGERRLYWTREAVERYSSAIAGTAHVVCEESTPTPPAEA
jgi:vacuolar-type H+-ATPase subunit I/STV1